MKFDTPKLPDEKLSARETFCLEPSLKALIVEAQTTHRIDVPELLRGFIRENLPLHIEAVKAKKKAG